MAFLQRSLTRKTSCFAAFLSALTVVSAAENPSAKSSTVSAVWMSGQSASGREFFIVAGDGKPVALSVGATSRGRPVEFTAGGSTKVSLLAGPEATAVRKTATSPVGGPIPVGEVVWSTGSAPKVLLVLAATKGAGVRGVALADDEQSFPGGNVKLANFTGAPVLVRLGQVVKTVAPGASEPIPYSVKADPKATDVPNFPFALATGEKVFFNGRIDAWPNSRTLVVVGPPLAAGKPPVVQILIDRVAPRVANAIAAR